MYNFAVHRLVRLFLPTHIFINKNQKEKRLQKLDV